MGKGIAVSTGIVIAGLLGSLTFVSLVPPALMNFLSQGQQAQMNQGFNTFVEDLKKACSGDHKGGKISGGITQYESTIKFAEPSDEYPAKVILVDDKEKQSEQVINCPVRNSQEKVLEDTVSYKITNQEGTLVVELLGVS